MGQARSLLFLIVLHIGAFAAFAQAQKPPVILISIDTLRADHLSAYGYRAVKTPNIDAFANGGTLYASADAQVPLTLPSHYSLFTSTYPFQNGIQENAQRIAPGGTTLAQVLNRQGYKTAAFIGSVFLEKEMGLDQGFDFYDSPFHYAAMSPLSGSVFFGGVTSGPNVGKDRRDAPLITRAAVQWLRANATQPAFAFLHFYDLHKPYKLASYDAELVYVDQVLGNFRQELIASGIWEKAIVILVSDHGESLGEHGEDSHGYFIYEATMHVPLLIHWPQSQQPARVETPVGLVDIAPTLLDYLNIPIPASFAGKSFLKTTFRNVYGESFHAHDSFGWAPLRSLRQGNWKYIDAPRPELYNLASDPGEKVNAIASNRKLAADLAAQLRQLLAANKPSAMATKPQQNQALLNSLGYLSPSPGGRKTTASQADPKDRLPEFQMYEDAILAQARGRLDTAISTLRKLLDRDPGNTLARRDLGACLIEKKNYTGALEHLTLVARVATDDYATQYLLGIAYKNLDQDDKALQYFNVACHLAPEAGQCRKQIEDLRSKKSRR